MFLSFIVLSHTSGSFFFPQPVQHVCTLHMYIPEVSTSRLVKLQLVPPDPRNCTCSSGLKCRTSTDSNSGAASVSVPSTQPPGLGFIWSEIKIRLRPTVQAGTGWKYRAGFVLTDTGARCATVELQVSFSTALIHQIYNLIQTCGATPLLASLWRPTSRSRQGHPGSCFWVG